MLLASSLLAFTLIAAPASEQERVAAARTAYEADDYTTAVRGFESLARDFPATAKYHYYAGLARENAGQDTHAYLNMHMFLASGAGTPEEKKLAAERAAAISRRTTRVRLQLPVEDLPAVLRLTYRGPKSLESRPVVVVPLAALPHVDTRPELALEPGSWELTVDPPIVGDLQLEPTTVEITAGTPTLPLRLKTTPILRLEASRATPTKSNDIRRRRQVGLSLAGLGLTTGVAGAVLLNAGNQILKDLPDPKPDTSPFFIFVDSSFGFFGAALGTWTAAAMSKRATRKGWLAGIITGSSLACLGAIAFPILSEQNSWHYKNDAPTPSLLSHPEVPISAFVLGLGVSLASSTGIGYLATSPRNFRKTRASFHISPAPLHPTVFMRVNF